MIPGNAAHVVVAQQWKRVAKIFRPDPVSIALVGVTAAAIVVALILSKKPTTEELAAKKLKRALRRKNALIGLTVIALSVAIVYWAFNVL